jgi:hypothetical protein
MGFYKQRQYLNAGVGEAIKAATAPERRELIIPNPKLKLLDQVREVLRLTHYEEEVGPGLAG